ncbi:hypothetical protein [Anaeromyxobacter oryzae]|uniref:Lipoprotein n=1 Tax=Anaeromyxobacter oryzae TaxID=2918170 RepID=A0ABM7WQF5_9BACT|nr:hypothetical protein [Anaeromyxobacter oryzae]BDG01693.1 hypothetical protein AMOR_06890 [Anaeromyxobacter oryzae]
MRRRVALPAFVVLVAGGCANGKAPEQSAGPVAAGASVPSDLTIVCGAGGGFTGEWEGRTVKPDGAVLAWRGLGAEEHPVPAGRLSPDARRALWDAINAARFFEVERHEPGNMTALVRVTAGGRTHEASWPLAEDAAAEPGSLDALYATCRDVVDRTER